MLRFRGPLHFRCVTRVLGAVEFVDLFPLASRLPPEATYNVCLAGFEPTRATWQAAMLPLHHKHIRHDSRRRGQRRSVP
jgi:hypothetical protein